jgi:hypothetical protein
MHYQYFRPDCLLIINPKGRIKILYTPFKVKCIVAVSRFPVSAWLWVDEVRSNNRDQLLFVVFNEVYPYSHFQIPTFI